MRREKHFTDGLKHTDVERLALSGPVKQVMEITYHAQIEAGKVVQGNIEAEYAHSNTNYIITFNKEGGRVKEQSYGVNDSEIDTYDEKGRKIESLKYYSGNFHSKTIYVYDNLDHLIEHTQTDKDGKLSFRVITSFNDLGQQTESIHYSGEEQKILQKTVYTYLDTIFETNGIKHRKLLSSIQYKGDGTVDYSYINTYDERGNQIENRWEHSDEKKKKYDRRQTQKYNEHNDCIEFILYNSDGSVKDVYNYTYQYDSEGKKIVPPRTDPPYDPYALEPGETEELEKDHHGNWIKKTLFFEKKPVNIMLRQISYYGEDSENQPEFIHPITLQAPAEIKDTTDNIEDLEPEQAKWLAEGTNTAEVFPAHRYYVMMYKEVPSVVTYVNSYIEAFAVLKKMQEDYGARIIHSAGSSWSGWRERLSRYTLSFKHYPGYILQATGINRYDEDEYVVPTYIDKLIDRDDYVHFSQFVLYRPSQASGKRNDWFEESILEEIDECTLRRKPEKPFIHIIETTQGGFVMKEHPVDDDFEIRDLDVNYGYGFQQFHTELMQRFNSSTKGLVLFHGEPGTGKTYYIRHLLRKMVDNRKVVIYMPPNMVDHLTEPAFMTFLAAEVRDFSAAGNFCVLLIEDAEPLLAKRQEGVRIQGVTNLLNLSDGLLNDMLNLQIICTFNVDLKKLDSALLRPGRLIARKEFKPLSELDANLLAQRLGIKHHFTAPATLSEIYAMRKNQNTLIHDVTPDRDASTLLDDL